ncbi:thioesterase domain-containing protein [Puniceicoccaceae bacterium K14]|nr:thioesterase domain-containing protein [Puniceicoccaceae bacterium K14]
MINLNRRKSDERIRLFCFPYAGGGSSAFLEWKKHLPARIEVCPLQYPGRENRVKDPLLFNIPDVVDDVIGQLLPYVDEPYALFGYSMGAIVAFEVARKLRTMQQSTPEHMIVAARSAPSVNRELPIKHLLGDSMFLESVKELGGTPAAFFEYPELVELILPILRADFQAIETYEYRCGEVFDFPITALGGELDTDSPPDSLNQWKRETKDEFKQICYPGGHFFLNDHFSTLIADIRAIFASEIVSARRSARV